MTPPEKGSNAPLWIALAVLLLVLVGAPAMFFAYAATRVMRTIEEMPASGSETDYIEPEPELRFAPTASWVKGVLTLDIALSTREKAPVRNVQITYLTLDDTFPKLNMPLKLGEVQPNRPTHLQAKFPGFAGSEGRLARAVLSFSVGSGAEEKVEADVLVPLRAK